MSIIFKSSKKNVHETFQVMYNYVMETLFLTNDAFGMKSWKILRDGDLISLPWEMADKANDAYLDYQKELANIEIIKEDEHSYSDLNIRVKGVVERFRRYENKKLWRKLHRDQEVITGVSPVLLEEEYQEWRLQRIANYNDNMAAMVRD